MMRSTAGRTWKAALAIVLACQASAVLAQTPPFRTETSLVTVDAVVVDGRGEPVADLAASDFEVIDAGVPQRIEAFQHVDAARGARRAEAGPAGVRRPYSSNVGAQPAALRTFVLVFDDLHLTRDQGERARQALQEFVRRDLAAGDLVSLVVPGSALRWHARIPEGRDELLAIAATLQGRFQPEPSLERITEYEAYRIHVFQDEAVAQMVDRRWRNYRQLGRQATDLATDRGFQPQERGGAAGVITQDLAIRAADVYSRTMARNRVTLGAMASMVRGLEAVRGRKSVLLFSAGLIEDQEQVDARQLVDASRRANVAIHFLDVRGIDVASAFASAQFGAPLDSRDVGFANAQIELGVQGSENLAADTGGFSVRNANDLGNSLARIARELSSYYLLGFQPREGGAPGTYRPLQVRVSRPGLVVRARKGYHVGGVAPATPRATLGADALQAVVDSPYDLDAIPMRAATYAFGSAPDGKVVVSIALEVDLRAFAFTPRDASLEDVLELRIAATHMGTSAAEGYDGQVAMTFPAGTRFGEDAWHLVARDFTLAPGRYQARIVVRDRNSTRVGAVTHAFDVPDATGVRVTTPIVTDTVETPAPGVWTDGAASRRQGGLGEPALPTPRPVLAVRRDFPAGATVYYQFRVVGAPAGTRVVAGHRVIDAAGTMVKVLEPLEIDPAIDGSLSRLAGLNMRGLPAGDYELLLSVIAEGTQPIELREPFTLR